MEYKMRFYKVILPLLAILSLWSAAAAEPVTKQLAEGITLYQNITTDPALITNVVKVDIANPAVKVRVALAKDAVMDTTVNKGREVVSSITARKGAVVGINADYFPFTGDPSGLCISDGELISETHLGRVIFAMLRDGSVFFDNPSFKANLTMANGVARQIDGINRGRETNQLVVYTPTYGASTLSKYAGTDVIATTEDLPLRAGCPLTLTVTEVKKDAVDTPIPPNGIVISAGGPAASFLAANVAVGDKLNMVFNIQGSSNIDWMQVEQAVAGGPWLVKDGKVNIDANDEAFKPDFVRNTHPRTAIGITPDSKLLIVTVDGRQAISGGITLPKLAEAMKMLGAYQAINLDGGGSTTLSVRGTVVNSPSGGAAAGNPYVGTERAVADMLLVYDAKKNVQPDLPKLKISGMGNEVISGEGTQLYLTWGDDDQMFTEDQMSKVVWGTVSGIGFIDQKGFFNPIKAKKGTIDAFYGSQKIAIPVTVVGGPTANIAIDSATDKIDPLRSNIKVLVTDANGNRLSDKDVALTITGGTADSISGKTDKNGEFATCVKWDAAAEKRLIKASVDDITYSYSVQK